MKTVIKFAGALLEEEATMRPLARQVAALANEGHEILVVHGGGRAFTEALKRMGIESKFVSGLRVTDRETRDAAVMVFAGLLNKRLAAAISAAVPRGYIQATQREFGPTSPGGNPWRKPQQLPTPSTT